MGTAATHANATYVALHCAASSNHCARATLQLVVRERLPSGRVVGVSATARRATGIRTVVIGSATVTLDAGQSETVKVSLNAAGHRLMARRSRLAAVLRITSNGAQLARREIQFGLAARKQHKRS
jgi:hypothetical protein